MLVGDDPASAVYVAGKQRACVEVGMVPFDRRLPADASFEQVADELERLNADRAVSGVLLQLPVPEHLDGPALTAIISPEKDVDGLTPVNAGLLSLGRPGLRPATPSGVMVMLDDAGVELEGAEAVVIGRSNLFGKPMAQMLTARNATVTVCHSRTRDLREVCSRADVLIAAVGRARLVQRDFVLPGAVVIDVGMNRLTPEEAGNNSGLVGDVDFARRLRGRRRDHAGARRRRSDDDRAAAAQHPAGRALPGRARGAARRSRPGHRVSGARGGPATTALRRAARARRRDLRDRVAVRPLL